jgi:hypothetical protein
MELFCIKTISVPVSVRSFSDAFKETMFRFDLKGSDLAEQSGLTAAQISQFRHGKNLRIDSLEKILVAMPPEARRYMLSLVLEENLEDGVLPTQMIPPAVGDGMGQVDGAGPRVEG